MDERGFTGGHSLRRTVFGITSGHGRSAPRTRTKLTPLRHVSKGRLPRPALDACTWTIRPATLYDENGRATQRVVVFLLRNGRAHTHLKGTGQGISMGNRRP